MLVRKCCLELSGHMVIEDDDRAREDDPITIKREPRGGPSSRLGSRKPRTASAQRVVTFIFVAEKLRIAPANKHRRGPSTSRYKRFFMRQICEALRSHGMPGQAG